MIDDGNGGSGVFVDLQAALFHFRTPPLLPPL